ncbi:hypothetical protein T484DRAFT_1964700 [Baffinella frigidus]|nr:hypothetical protein T484DRAFT_1964700 [Cryptophyta sp. CCMP2293]
MSCSVSDDVTESPPAILGSRKKLRRPVPPLSEDLLLLQGKSHSALGESPPPASLLSSRQKPPSPLHSMINFCAKPFAKYFLHRTNTEAAAEVHTPASWPSRNRSSSVPSFDFFPQHEPELELTRPARPPGRFVQPRRNTQEKTIHLLTLQATRSQVTRSRSVSDAPAPVAPAPRRRPSVRFAITEKNPNLFRPGWSNTC